MVLAPGTEGPGPEGAAIRSWCGEASFLRPVCRQSTGIGAGDRDDLPAIAFRETVVDHILFCDPGRGVAMYRVPDVPRMTETAERA